MKLLLRPVRLRSRCPRILRDIKDDVLRTELHRCLAALARKGITPKDAARIMCVPAEWMRMREYRVVPPWLILAVKAIEAGFPVTEERVEDRVMELLDGTIAAIDRELNRLTP